MYLEGLSTHWVWKNYQAGRNLDCQLVWYTGHRELAFFQFVGHRSTREAQALLGDYFGGTLLADAYASYNGTHPRARQSCLAHLIRKAGPCANSCRS